MTGIRFKLITALVVAVMIPLLLGLGSLRYFGSRYFVGQQGRLFMNSAAYTASSLEEGIIAKTVELSGWVSLSSLGAELAAFNRDHPGTVPSNEQIQSWESEWAAATKASPLVAGILDNPIADQIRAFSDLNLLLVELLVTDQIGRIVAGTNKSSDYWQADETWWHKAAALERGEAWVEGIHFDESAGVYSVDAALPIYGPDGFAGVLKAVIDASPLLRSLSLRRQEAGPVRDVVLETGEILVRLTGQPIDPLSESFGAINEEVAGSMVMTSPSGEKRLVGYASVRGTRSRPLPPLNSDIHPMTVVVYRPLDQVLAPLNHQLWIVSLSGCAVALLFAFVGYHTASQKLVRPIQTLRAAARDIAATTQLKRESGESESRRTRSDAEKRLEQVERIETADEIEELARDFGLMSRRVLHYHEQMEQEITAKTEEIQQDLVMARHFQEALLPDSLPKVPDPPGDEIFRLEFFHVYKPTLSVGGDFFDVHKIEQNKAGVFIGDVMGHGARSALVTAILHTMLQEAGARATTPGELLTMINERFARIVLRIEDFLFVSAFYMCLNTDSGTIEYASAGHPPPLVVSRPGRTIQPLMDEADAGPALGLKKHTEYRTSSRQIDVGDAIVLFTDGVTEAMNPAHAEYGEDRLQKTIRAALERGESDLPRSILDDLHVFMDTEPAHDDICVVSVEAVEISK